MSSLTETLLPLVESLRKLLAKSVALNDKQRAAIDLLVAEREQLQEKISELESEIEFWKGTL